MIFLAALAKPNARTEQGICDLHAKRQQGVPLRHRHKWLQRPPVCAAALSVAQYLKYAIYNGPINRSSILDRQSIAFQGKSKLGNIKGCVGDSGKGQLLMKPGEKALVD